MFRVSLANAFAKRTLRPLLEKHQATPVSVSLDSSATDPIYSGMVASLTSDGTVVISDGSNAFGLFALDANDIINDLDGQPSDLRPFAVWQGGPDAYFRVDAPAFDTSASGTYEPGAALRVADDGSGKLTVDGTGTVVGQVIEVVSGTRLVIRVSLPA